jgi:hypothetical protein
MNASDLAARLAADAESVCRHFLSAGRREGAYWRCGDVGNTPGRSLYVRLRPPHAGKWTDAATGEHGDLLDLIAARQGFLGLGAALDEARRFLALPRNSERPQEPASTGSPDAARRLFAAARPLTGTPAEAYLKRRGLTRLHGLRWLRFHPSCFHRTDDGASAWPALLAAVTDLDGSIQGLQRIWLTRSGLKAPLAEPRRTMGRLLGNAVRFGRVSDVLAAGEGLESALSLREALPRVPLAAALSAAHLGALALPAKLQRLYIALDDDAAGWRAADRLTERAVTVGVEAIRLVPKLDDFNADLVRLGRRRLARGLRPQVKLEDWARFASPTG